jgi:hypothetical protein
VLEIASTVREKARGYSLTCSREDDVAWPKKNIVGKQELEVRIDKEHISFEVS